MRLLITGATGKVGRHALTALLSEPRFRDAALVAFCHARSLPPMERVEVVTGSIANPGDVARAMEGVTHVLHLAAVKESPDLAIDVSIKGLFLLLDAFRQGARGGRFVLLSGDCAIGHIFQSYPGPITESAPRRAYPGCYALTKILEEVMVEQTHLQYGTDTCWLRVPWIMEKDDLRFALSFGKDQFGGPAWDTLMPPDQLALARWEGRVPLMLAADGAPLRRNFIAVEDVVSALLTALDHPAARGEGFNIAMDQPADYARLAQLVEARTGARPMTVETPFHSNVMDIAKARKRLGWRPEIGIEELVEQAWNYKRAANEARKIWYPG